MEYQKIYKLPRFDNPTRELNKIVFELTYTFKGKQYQSNSVLPREYISTKFERAIEHNDLDRIEVRCKKRFPKESIVLLKKD